MTGLDTTVLVRYMMQDDGRQSRLATRIVESLSPETPGFVPLVAIVELSWVLTSAYELDRNQLIEALEALLRAKELVVESGQVVWKALRLFQRANGHFADCLIAGSAEAAGCTKTMTFDRGAVRHGGMTRVA